MMINTNTILQLSAAISAPTAAAIVALWQQQLPDAAVEFGQHRLLRSLWQQQARTVLQHQKQHQIPAILQIWQQGESCWLLLSWQPEHCDLNGLWQALATVPATAPSGHKPLLPQTDPAQFLPTSKSGWPSLPLSRLRHQLQHSVLQPVELFYNTAPGLTLQQEQLTPAIATTLCSDNPTALLFLTLPLPACLAQAQLVIAAVAQGLCLLDVPGGQQQLAGPLLSPLQQQALLEGFYRDDTDASASVLAAAIEPPCAVTILFQQLQHSQFALEWGEQHWSAKALSGLVAAWQHQISHLPLGAIVAVDLARGPSQLAACLACLFAGCAFVPFDRQLPALRLQQQLTQLQPALLLSDRLTPAMALPTIPVTKLPVTTIPVATIPVATLPHHAVNTIPLLQPTRSTALAYLMFTSGSTGTPKAVMLNRQALSTFLAAAAERTALQPTQRVLAHTSVGFDISLLELLLPLYCGARLRLLAEQQNRALAAEPALLAGVDLLQGTPTLFRALLASGWQGQADLTVLAGGEALDTALISQLKKRCGRLLHCYGPTEATIWSMMAETPETPVLGPSLPGYRHRVLCSDGGRARAGMVGELLIASPALADGYWQQDTLTAQRFVTAADGVRWYHSGDLVRQLTADRYQYLGRLDDQIKLRGHRIELSEIESVLRQQSAVYDCAVLLLREPDRLLACLVGEQTQEPHIRTQLTALLPTYMRPQLLWLDSLPCNSSGKTDKQALQRSLCLQTV
ncbi:hypothetical protein EOE67_14680 [Rheinheimera riviphila]|uniref:AMP-dependent synthetase/ligase domain-containing protein n=1 Tax=Rheinheimera riviphila TaxID=1834037 RepID=A0A437QIX4_9GAMM|nr:AMP-binding protein [Rheinheimera riviphila]RVU34491.1 hypothetical protein EOE67_14680 [Rheinheimera riviphila]